MDYYSKWPCVSSLRSTTFSSLIGELDRIFADLSIPSELVSDNGTQFASQEFRHHCRQKDIEQITSSPAHPQSNSMAERTVQTVKKRLLNMVQEGQTLLEALLAIRSTPVDSKLPSPSVLLQGRNLRGTLPFVKTELQHRVITAEYVKRQLQQRQAAASFTNACPSYARGSVYHVGQLVRVRVSRKWISGRVSGVCQQPHSYRVSKTDGREFRRTRRAIYAVRVGVSGDQPGQPATEARNVQKPASRMLEIPSRSTEQVEEQDLPNFT